MKMKMKDMMKNNIKTTGKIITDKDIVKDLNVINEFIIAVDNIYTNITNSKIKTDIKNSIENIRKKEIAARKYASYIKEYYK